ncbi:ATPase family associated with various cellular activities (AAA) [Paenibacillus sp. UNCCL117]|uniref:AAA family ATPase n=1 Tax=unclassified Paenibacillus TaxID=185978 RepID=UPI000882104F|nr:MULTISPECIES: ATP-binding protein [unclassified Paenibacillus]SDD65017.1 ATPase family associated with various cellular activities (AAA) [Paenibacillus sp. cl123]SFW58207.1 ATPase family associated with various cellular activities (AAA) [Paenibacillus sp. UNCCL117]
MIPISQSTGNGSRIAEALFIAAEAYEDVLYRIRFELSGLYGYEFNAYVCDDGSEDYWQLLEQDIRSGYEGAEYVARIFDFVESRAFSTETDPSGGEEGDGRCRIYSSLRNNVFAYPALGVALARVPVFRHHGLSSEDFVFARDDQAVQSFLAFTANRRREQDRRQVTVFTDTRDGMERQIKPITRTVDRDDVLMSEELKTEIFRAIDQFFAEDRSFYRMYEVPYKRGILLYGKPGNGKTTLVKSIAGSVRAPVAYWQLTEHTSSASIQEVFAAAVAMAPMVLVAEDIDSMPLHARSFFLNTLDGATSKEGIFLIGTTNYPEQIDPALMNRAGRFDRAYEIVLPDEELRTAYLRRKPFARLIGEEALPEAARLTESFTFAQLNELYVSAALQWHTEGHADLHALIRAMRQELDKSRRQTWLRDKPDAAVGFLGGGR